MSVVRIIDEERKGDTECRNRIVSSRGGERHEGTTPCAASKLGDVLAGKKFSEKAPPIRACSPLTTRTRRRRGYPTHKKAKYKLRFIINYMTLVSVSKGDPLLPHKKLIGVGDGPPRLILCLCAPSFLGSAWYNIK